MTSNQKNTVIEILQKSFNDNQSVNFVIKQDSKREKRLKKLMEYSVFQGVNFGEIYLTEDNQACAIVLDPKKKKTTLKSVLWDLKLVFGCMGVGNVSKVMKRESLIKKNHPNFDFLHLWYIGVNPDKQSKGLGTQLMKTIIEDAQLKGLPVYLETSTTRNFPFYENLGFERIAEMDSLGYPLKMYLKH